MARTIANIAKVIGSGLTPLRSNPLFWNSPDISWLKTEQLGAHVIYDTKEYISRKAMDETSIKLWPPHTVSIAMYGEGKTRGNVSIIMSEMTTNQACFNVIVDDSLADYRFLYYWLKYNYEHLRSLASGVRKNLNSDDIKNFPFPDFGLDYQISIAQVLSSIDDRIDNNNKICTELESMAKTLYDYWFVQFDFPDENGKPYRTGGGKMKYSKPLKSMIPEGWIETVLSNIAYITMGQSPSGESYNEAGEGEVFYQGSTDFGNRFPTPRVYTTAPSRFAKKGDILMSVRAPVGTLNIAMEDCCIGRGLSALNSKSGSQLHLLCVLTGYKMRFDAMNSNGTTFGSINKDQLSALPVVAPPGDVLNRFETIVGPIEKKIEDCERQNRCLAKLRDWLLPMLMNGQAVICDMEETMNLKNPRFL